MILAMTANSYQLSLHFAVLDDIEHTVLTMNDCTNMWHNSGLHNIPFDLTFDLIFTSAHLVVLSFIIKFHCV